jgi:hypothetical protein
MPIRGTPEHRERRHNRFVSVTTRPDVAVFGSRKAMKVKEKVRCFGWVVEVGTLAALDFLHATQCWLEGPRIRRVASPARRETEAAQLNVFPGDTP